MKILTMKTTCSSTTTAHIRLLSAWVIMLFVTTSVFAADWVNPNGGSFHLDTNWNPSVPLSGDRAIIGLAGEYTITLEQNTTVDGIALNTPVTGIVTLDLGGYLLTGTSSNVGSAALNMNPGNDESRTLRVINGTLDVQTLRVGHGSGSQSSAAILEMGGGSTLLIRGDNRIGNQRPGELRILSGAQLAVYHSELLIGRGPTTGVLIVDGAGSRVNLRPESSRAYLRLGGQDDSEGLARVTGGGVIEGVSYIELARIGDTSKGTLEVIGSGSTVRAERIYVGGRVDGGETAGGEARLKVTNQGLVELSSRLVVFGKGEVELDGGQIQASASQWHAGSRLNLILNTVNDVPHQTSGDIDLIDNGVHLALGLADGFSGQSGEVYTVFRYGGTLTGQFADFAEGAIVGVEGSEWSFALSYGSGTNDQITLTLIPEPSTYALLLSGLAVVATIVVRRRTR